MLWEEKVGAEPARTPRPANHGGDTATPAAATNEPTLETQDVNIADDGVVASNDIDGSGASEQAQENGAGIGAGVEVDDSHARELNASSPSEPPSCAERRGGAESEAGAFVCTPGARR